jgi:hypothetical protein
MPRASVINRRSLRIILCRSKVVSVRMGVFFALVPRRSQQRVGLRQIERFGLHWRQESYSSYSVVVGHKLPPEVLMRSLHVCLASLLLLALAACTTDSGGTPQPQPNPTPPPSLAGSWQATTPGNLFDNEGLGTLQYLKFTETSDSSGRLEVFGVHPESNVLACDGLIYAALADDVVSLFSKVLDSRLLSYKKDGDRLILTNEQGVSQTLTKVADVPASSVCEQKSFEASFETIPVRLTSFTSLLSDGTNLRVSSEDGNVYPIDPNTGALGTGVPLGGDFNLGGTMDDTVTMQGATDFWAHCGCGGSQEIVRFKAGDPAPTDIVDTGTDLGKEIGVRQAAFDGTDLWIAGFSFDDGRNLVLRVNAEVEPDVLVSQFAFNHSMQGLTFHDGGLWALVDVLGPKLVQIDPTQAKAVRTLSIPELSQGRYQGLTSIGGSLYLLAETSNSTAAVFRLTP